MKTRTDNPDRPTTAQELLDGYMEKLHQLGEEYEIAVASGDAADYYLSHLERQMERLEALAYLYMDVVTSQNGSHK